MMESVLVAVAAFSLLSVGQSAPVTSCESLIQPLEIQGRDQLLGKWMLVAESANFQDAEVKLNTFRESQWLKISAANESDAIIFTNTVKLFGFCVTLISKMTLENNTLQPPITNETSEHPPRPEGVFKLSAINLLKTGCPDCLVFRRDHHLGLLLLSKRRTVTDAELEEFKKQGECLDLPWTFNLNPEGGLCPEPPPEETDVMHFLVNGQRSDFLKVIEMIVSSAGGLSSFLEMDSELS